MVVRLMKVCEANDLEMVRSKGFFWEDITTVSHNLREGVEPVARRLICSFRIRHASRDIENLHFVWETVVLGSHSCTPKPYIAASWGGSDKQKTSLNNVLQWLRATSLKLLPEAPEGGLPGTESDTEPCAVY